MPIYSTPQRISLMVDNDFVTNPERKNVAVSVLLSMLDISCMLVSNSIQLH